MKTLKYLRYIIIHKYWVFKYCLKYGLVWRGLVHDLSKLLPSEFPMYRDYFYDRETMDTKKKFNYAWNKHQKRNLHHWQAWLLFLDDGGIERLNMPLKYRKEMIADWRGASMAIRGFDDTLNWYNKNRCHMEFSPETQKWVENEIGFNRIGELLIEKMEKKA